jgi:hypothetical protein
MSAVSVASLSGSSSSSFLVLSISDQKRKGHTVADADTQVVSDPNEDAADIGAGIRDGAENDAADPVPVPDQTLTQSPLPWMFLFSCARV